MDRETLWKTVLGELQVVLSPTNFKTWVRETELVKIDTAGDNRQMVTIACKSPYHRETVENRYYGQIKMILDKLTEKRNELVFAVQPVKQGEILEPSAGPLFSQNGLNSGTDMYKRAVERVRLRADFVFDTFAVSNTNEMAYAAAAAVAKNPGQAYHLLFFYGGVGVGKTHLMQAVGHQLLQDVPEAKVIYCTGEEFTNGLIDAIQRKTTQQFKQKFRTVKLLMVDDVQFIAGKDYVQEEFFHTFNAIAQNRGQIILTSDRLPTEIRGLEDRLRSRFEGGLTIDIQQPDFELRTAILRIKAQAQGVDLPMDTAKLIAANIESTRRLEGFLMTLMALSKTRGEAITPEMVTAQLGVSQPSNGERKYIKPKEVVEIVAGHFNLKSTLLRGERRSKDLVEARHIAMYLLRIDLGVSLEEVGSHLGGRDHTTVMHAVDKIKANLSNSENLRTEVESIRKALYG